MKVKNLIGFLLIIHVFSSMAVAQVEFKKYTEVKNPLQQKEIVLMFHHERVAGAKGTYELTLRCQEDLPLSQCQNTELHRRFFPKVQNGQVSNEQLGILTRAELPGLFNTINTTYFAKYNAAPLYIGSASGFIVGIALGKIPATVALTTAGLIIDVIKLPLSLPYTITSKIHRAAQKRKIAKRLNALMDNKDFKSTRILGNHQFHIISNAALEYCLARPKSNR